MSASANLGPQFFHASDSPTWNPQPGVLHAGTEDVAWTRARHEGRRYVHELAWDGPVHHEVVPDAYANFASGNQDRPRHEVYQNLRWDQQDHGTDAPGRVLGRIGRALRVEGKAVPYKNVHESHEGSTSYVLPDARKARLVRTRAVR